MKHEDIPSGPALGNPIRNERPRELPIEGRPGWVRDRFSGQERYVEPPKPPQTPAYPACFDWWLNSGCM